MKIGLIGCGRVGTTIFYHLKKYNRIIGVYDRSKKAEQRARNILELKKNLGFAQMCVQTQALFFATNDDELINAYKKARPFLENKKFVYHFSGILPASIFPKDKHIYRASLHPFTTFCSFAMPDKNNIYYLFVEGEQRAVTAAKKIFFGKNFILKKLNTRKKTKHHLLGVFVSNLFIGLFAAAQQLANELGWNEKDIKNILIPIMETTLDNIKQQGTKNALTGPLERGDIKVIKKHLNTLKKNKNLLDIYKALSSSIIKNLLKDSSRFKRADFDI